MKIMTSQSCFDPQKSASVEATENTDTENRICTPTTPHPSIVYNSKIMQCRNFIANDIEFFLSKLYFEIKLLEKINYFSLF